MICLQIILFHGILKIQSKGDRMFNCDNSTVLKVVLLVKNILDLVKIIGPIILIIWAIIDIVRLVVSDMSDEKVKSTKKKIVNRFLAVILIFVVPTILNVVMTSIGKENIESTSCWINANKEYIEKKKAEEEKLEAEKIKADKEARELTENQRREQALRERKAIAFNKPSKGDPNGGGILIIAGHAYQPECLACGDCRGTTSSGYAEEAETRSLAISLKKALLKKGVNAVIANQVLVGDENDERMNASFLCSRGGSGNYANTFSKLEAEGYWNSFAHIIEIHFNATGSHTAYGTMIMTSGGQTSNVSPIDNQILDTVSSFTGYNRGVQGYSGGTLGNWNFFKNKNKSITYIEVEFYDNNAAMRKYKNDQERMAEAIADKIKSAGY